MVHQRHISAFFRQALALLFFVAIVWQGSNFAQNGQYENAPSNDDLWALIQKQMDVHPSENSFPFIQLLVRGKCTQDFVCQYDTYAFLKEKLERSFQLPVAIVVCDEMVEVARQSQNLEMEAMARVDLYRFHDAVGDKFQATQNIDLAEQLFMQAGNKQALIRIRMDKAEQSLAHRSINEVLPEMYAILATALENKDTLNANLIRIHLIQYTLEVGQLEEMRRLIEAIEQVHISSPVKQDEYKFLIYAALGRAELAEAKGDVEKAMMCYQKAVQYCLEEPSRWLEINTLRKMAALEWEMGNSHSAKEYLDRAQEKATALELYDLLAEIFSLKAEIAEEEGLFADALAFTKEKLSHEEEFNNRSAGFDLQNHKLKKEKERLTAIKEHQAEELKKKDAQMGSAIIFISIILLLILVFVVVYLQKNRSVENVHEIHVQPIGKEIIRQPVLLSADEEEKPGPSSEMEANESDWLKNFELFVIDNLSSELLTVPMLANKFAMSESSLLRQVKRLTGLTPQKYIQELRLDQARVLLENQGCDSVAEVASEVGYSDTRSFSRRFKKRFGKLPSDFTND